MLVKEEPGMDRVGRRESIETEPKTLNVDQIQDARDEALFVVCTRSKEEALSIFTEGLKPVVSKVEQNEDWVFLDLEDEKKNLKVEPLRDVVSAPF